MIRSILVPLGEGLPAIGALEFAFWLAGKYHCHLHALAVIDVKAFEIPIMGTPDGFMPSVVTPPLDESQSLLEEFRAAARENLEKFAAECATRGLTCSCESRTGIPGEIVVREAVAHDLVVMARKGYSRTARPNIKVEPVVQHVIRGSIRPVLVAAAGFPESGDIQRILVAFDGSVHAARSLTIAAELGARASVQCMLLTVAGSEEAGQEILAPAEAYLYHHGVSPVRKVVRGTKPSELICELAEASRADLLVMGAYGHSPIREMIFGSTSEQVLSQCGSTVILQS